ncbi:hypothetical protein AB0C90_22185 [Streptomyces sp. NPDC048550]|uniref:hypothetical protein n=1 Tax=unclassified Streptomyces TaxID=2593676 RepID=UPI00225029FF|nr:MULTISPECIES: hypothetical protein [unclassified Streptomyces]MCX5148901.1 hypothetical protein [Streptomyces sp. NBC_00320]WSN51957.1 hypothetical protein OG299_31860 [Streptomyces sp. NBC_01296]WSW58622.1 hypothetical protein OG513_08530 [Streptomyces sp. NBC_00998]
MTTLETPGARTGRRRRTTPQPDYEESVPRHEESVQQRHPDPPIYRALLAHWAAEERTLPGSRDPEWSRVATSPIWPDGPLYGN